MAHRAILYSWLTLLTILFAYSAFGANLRLNNHEQFLDQIIQMLEKSK